MSAILELDAYWKNFYSSTDQHYNKLLNQMPPEVKSYFEVDYYPEPFYGYLTEDISNDIVLLVLNPGGIDYPTHQNFFKTTDPNELLQRANEFVKTRHLYWNKDNYIEYEQYNYPGKQWRNTKLNQCEKIVGHSIPFLHTIELFPFHSKNWNMKKSIRENWLYKLESTQLFIDAIEEMAKKKKPRYILAIGKTWVDILEKYPETFYLAKKEQLLGPKGRLAHAFYQFRLKGLEDSLPIVIYSTTSTNLPTRDENAKRIIRDYLEIENINSYVI